MAKKLSQLLFVVLVVAGCVTAEDAAKAAQQAKCNACVKDDAACIAKECAPHGMTRCVGDPSCS